MLYLRLLLGRIEPEIPKTHTLLQRYCSPSGQLLVVSLAHIQWTHQSATENTKNSRIFCLPLRCKPMMIGKGSMNIAMSIATLKTPVATTVPVTTKLDDRVTTSTDDQFDPDRGAQYVIHMTVQVR